MLKDWKLCDLHMKVMKLESAVTGQQQITHQVNKIGSYSYRSIDRKHQNQNVCDFKALFQVNNRLMKLLINTGAKVSVCGMKQAKTLGLLDKMRLSSATIHPNNSEPIKVRGIPICAVTYKDRTVPVEFYILPGSSEAILAGDKGIQLKVMTIDKNVAKTDDVFNPVSMLGCSTEVPDEYNTCTDKGTGPNTF